MKVEAGKTNCMQLKIMLLIVFLLSFCLYAKAQKPIKITASDGIGPGKKLSYSAPKKSRIKTFAAKDFSFVINFAGIPEKETTDTNFIGLKISTTLFEVQRPSDYSFVKIYDFPFELKNSKEVANRLGLKISKNPISGGEIASENHVSVSGFEGKEIVAESDYDISLFKILVVRNRVYVISSVAYKWAINSALKQKDFEAETKRLFDSFKLLPFSGNPPAEVLKDWVQYVSEEGSFKISMPTIPKKSVDETEIEVGKFPVNHFSSTPRSLYDSFNMYQISYADMPFIITDEKIRDALYEKSKQNALKNGKKLILEKDYLYNDYKGKELLTEDEKFIYHSRILYYKQRMFFLFVMVAKPLEAPQEVYESVTNKFFTTFEIVEK